ncbi:DNA polymerase IV [Clostridiisalibacter paucivorans]|uniref:DNA polymerase IV n=1 Tax=Clostridiisalibacter paucivorans TaxID=408753 RepID=UPI00047AE964|nr:DNA polymerase IV [Clostridiisalibacter paucivorans]
MDNRWILHVDMDAFYASIEQRDRPNLKNKPVIVGGNPYSRGVVCAASYEARKFGIRSAMPSKKAKALCPKAVFVPVNKNKYKKVSQKLHDIFYNYSNKIEPISLDEAFLDVSGKNPLEIAKKIKEDINNKLYLTASVGISYNKFLAKLASDMKKPDGLTIIQKNEAIDILKPLSIRKLWGVGPKTEKKLKRLGIYRIEDIQKYDKKTLVNLFGKRGEELIDFANGIDNRPVENPEGAQSIGEENTFLEDTNDIKILHERVDRYVKDVVTRILRKRYRIKTVTLKIKYEDFTVETRSITLDYSTDDFNTINRTAHYILDNRFNIDKKVRLLGVTLSNIVYFDEPIQLSLNLDKYI